MLDRRTLQQFTACLALGPLLVLIGIVVDQTLGMHYARLSNSLIVGGAIDLLAILSIVIGSGLAILGALKVTEWVSMPAQRRHHIRPMPVLTATWTIALCETSILFTLALLWMLRV